MHLAPALLALATLITSLPAAETPPAPTREEAASILSAMEYREVNVIAVVHGVSDGKVTAPSVASVLALAKRDGAYADLKLNLFYDRELGWFTYESTPRQFRVWTQAGYREIKAGTGY